MNVPEDKLLDKRLIRRHLDRGLLEQATYDAHLDGLQDAARNAHRINIDLSSVGVSDVRAKDTGENE